MSGSDCLSNGSLLKIFSCIRIFSFTFVHFVPLIKYVWFEHYQHQCDSGKWYLSCGCQLCKIILIEYQTQILPLQNWELLLFSSSESLGVTDCTSNDAQLE